MDFCVFNQVEITLSKSFTRNFLPFLSCVISKIWKRQSVEVLDFSWLSPFIRHMRFWSSKILLLNHFASISSSEKFCVILKVWKKQSVKFSDCPYISLLNSWKRFHLIKIMLLQDSACKLNSQVSCIIFKMWKE